jgi:hypothetical protein
VNEVIYAPCCARYDVCGTKPLPDFFPLFVHPSNLLWTQTYLVATEKQKQLTMIFHKIHDV